MRILAIDTSGPACGAAVVEEGRVLSEETVQNKNTHSANLMLLIEEVLRAAGTALAEVDGIACVVGPGSFTGVRIGAATAKGLAHGSGKPCIPVNALEALCRGAGAFPGVILPIQDARAGQVYGAAFRGGSRLMPDSALALEDFLRAAETAAGDDPGPFLFTGDGVAVHEKRIRELWGEKAVFAEAPFRYLRPAAAGMIALEKGERTDYRSLRETYLRPPNAQKNKKLLEAMRNG